MTRIGEFRGGPWRGLLAAGVAVLALSVGLPRGAGAAGAPEREILEGLATGDDVNRIAHELGGDRHTVTP